MKSRMIPNSNDDSTQSGLPASNSFAVKISGAESEKHESKSNNLSVSYFDSTDKTWKLVFCFVGLQLSYITWGIFQEQLMTKEYKMGRFKSSAFCVFGNRFLALFISLGIVIYKKLVSPKPLKEAPYYSYAPSSISNTISSWAQYEALKHVSFPTQVLSKSCKVIPVMLVGL